MTDYELFPVQAIPSAPIKPKRRTGFEITHRVSVFEESTKQWQIVEEKRGMSSADFCEYACSKYAGKKYFIECAGYYDVVGRAVVDDGIYHRSRLDMEAMKMIAEGKEE